MIESIQGKHETVNFKDNSAFKLYLNNEFEDYPDHWHTPVEVIVPLQNGYQVICSGISYNLKEGDILIITPGTIHRIYAPESGLRIIFQVDSAFVNLFKDVLPTLSLLAPAKLITAENSPEIYQELYSLILKIRDEWIQRKPLNDVSIFSGVAAFFVLMGRDAIRATPRFDAVSGKQQEYTEKFLNICDYITDHCTEALTLEEIASRAGFSKFHFARLFKQFTGSTFYTYLNQKRVAYAENLLIDPSLSITEIAYQTGFNSSSAFGRTFKAIKTYTPSNFRKMYAGA